MWANFVQLQLKLWKKICLHCLFCGLHAWIIIVKVILFLFIRSLCWWFLHRFIFNLLFIFFFQSSFILLEFFIIEFFPHSKIFTLIRLLFSFIRWLRLAQLSLNLSHSKILNFSNLFIIKIIKICFTFFFSVWKTTKTRL